MGEHAMTGSSIPGPPGQEPDTAAQDTENVRAAARLRDQRPGWVVIWAPPLRCYSASPLFRAPRGTHLRAATVDELAALMDQVEQAAARPRTRPRSPGT
jgi:hypothetical protein